MTRIPTMQLPAAMPTKAAPRSNNELRGLAGFFFEVSAVMQDG